MMLSSGDQANYFSERSAGVYEIDLQLHLRIRLRFWFVKTGRWTPRIDCDNLRIPVMNGTVSSGTFEPVRCRFDW